jgi:hypothetical protein
VPGNATSVMHYNFTRLATHNIRDPIKAYGLKGGAVKSCLNSYGIKRVPLCISE